MSEQNRNRTSKNLLVWCKFEFALGLSLTIGVANEGTRLRFVFEVAGRDATYEAGDRGILSMCSKKTKHNK